MSIVSPKMFQETWKSSNTTNKLLFTATLAALTSIVFYFIGEINLIFS